MPFHRSLRNDTHYGPKPLDFAGLLPQPKTLNPIDHRVTSILALFPRVGAISRELVLRLTEGFRLLRMTGEGKINDI